MNETLLYIGSLLPIMWGITHLFPTKSIIRGFGNISLDNKRIIAMEWIIEGVALMFIGITILIVTYIGHQNTISRAVYWISIISLNTLSVVSLFTGARIGFIPFRLCPVIFTGSSIFLLLGLLL